MRLSTFPKQNPVKSQIFPLKIPSMENCATSPKPILFQNAHHVSRRKTVSIIRPPDLNSIKNTRSETSFSIFKLSKNRPGQILNKISASRSKPNQLNYENQIIIVEIDSNWGSSDYLRIAQIELLDDYSYKIPIRNIISHPYMDMDFTPLYDGKVEKDNIEEVWKIKWPQLHKLSLLVLYDIDKSVSSVRIFNSNFDSFSSVKDVKIKLDNDNIFKAEVPKSFVTDIKVLKMDNIIKVSSNEIQKQLKMMFPEKHIVKHVFDKYGRYPFMEIETIKFDILATRSKSKFCGLNGIEFYNNKFKKIKNERIEDIILTNCPFHNDAELLFKKNKQTDEPEKMFHFENDLSKERSSIEIRFNKKVSIARISIWNYNGNDEKTACGVKKMVIKFNKIPIWAGIIKPATGIARGARYNTTEIILNDIEEQHFRIEGQEKLADVISSIQESETAK